jgi:hypothetical protein
MEKIMEAIAPDLGGGKSPTEDFSEILLSALRCAILRAKLDANEFHTIGLALRNHAISPDGAIDWLTDAGLIGQVISSMPNEQRPD